MTETKKKSGFVYPSRLVLYKVIDTIWQENEEFEVLKDLNQYSSTLYIRCPWCHELDDGRYFFGTSRFHIHCRHAHKREETYRRAHWVFLRLKEEPRYFDSEEAYRARCMELWRVSGEAGWTERADATGFICPPPYEWCDSMGEISGVGGGYEQTCRKMVQGGMAWLDAHPDAEPVFMQNTNIYGVVREDNDDAKALSEAITGADEDCTGATHHAAVKHCLAIKEYGWEGYVKKMRDIGREGKEAEA